MSPLPRPILALLIVATFLLPLVPTANAQSTGADLVVDTFDLGDGVAGRQTTIHVVVKNIGDKTFTGVGGWQLFLSWRGPNDPLPPRGAAKCLEGQQVEGTSAVCYQKVAAGQNNNIAPQNTVSFDVQWPPDRATQGGSITITTWIEPLACERQPFGSGSPASCTDQGNVPNGPDDAGRRANNVADHHVFIKVPGVRAVPLRDPPPSPNSDVNSGWSYPGDITEPCKKSPAINTRGCKAQPDTLIVFQYLLINEGNSGDTFTPVLPIPDTDTSPQALRFRQISVTFQPKEVVIPQAGGTKVVNVEILIGKGEKQGNSTNIRTVTATLKWVSALDHAQTTDAPPDPPCDDALKAQNVCKSPSFPSIVIDAKHDLNATTLEAFKQANVSEPDDFNFTLNNTGNVQDTYALTLDRSTAQINDSWNLAMPATVTVPAFTEKRVTLTITAPANATKGVHDFDIIAQSIQDTEGTTLRHISFHPDLQQQYGLGASLDTQTLRVVPADPANFVIRLENTGNGPDNMSLSLENVPPLWSAVLSDRLVRVPAFSTVPVYLNVTSPEGIAADTKAAIFVNATSQGPPDKLFEDRPHRSVDARVTILPGSNVHLTAGVTSSFIDPGELHDFDITVRNTGNAKDNFSVTLDRDQSQIAWTASVTPTFLVLESLQSATVRVSLRAPPSAHVGESTKVFVTVRSTAVPGTFKQIGLDGRVSGPDLFVASILPNATTPYAGDPLEVNVVFGNAGNLAPGKNVSLKLYFVPQNGAPRPIGEKTVSGSDLPGGRRLSEKFVWDTAGVDGPGTLLARIDEPNDIEEIDESATSNEVTRAITLRIFDVKLTAAQSLSGRPGEKVSYGEAPYVFVARYDGNQASEPVDILIESEHGWGGSRLSIALPRGSPVPILADLLIPTHPGVASDTLRVSIIPSLRPTSIVSATAVTTVLDDEAPVIADVSTEPLSVKLGQPIALKARVTDATGLASVRAFVVLPSGESQSVLLDQGPGDVWTHTQAWPAAGVYRYYVEATDNSASHNKNSSRDTLATFTVAPGSAPTIALASGQPTTIRTGSPIRLNISDPLGVGRANYTIKGVVYELTPPFTIDTSSFTAGTVDLTVTAVNVYGVPTSQKFSFVVDNTPPGIKSVTLSPPKPKVNQEVTVHVETDAKVNSVQVLVKRDGQVVETKDATRRTNGVFEATFSPGEGDYTVDVTAKDVAGNTKLQEGAVSFSAKPGSPFDTPGPPLWMGILALAAIAIVMRRR